MMNYKFGDVVTVPFPFVDRPIQKLRPALVLSNKPDGNENKHLVMAMITSAKRSRWISDIILMDWKAAGLNAPSIVRWKIFTIEAALVQNRRGMVSEKDLSALKTGFDNIMRI